MLTLYHCANARSFRPLWTLEELGLSYDLRMLPFPPRFLKREYLDLNPLGTIPLLIDGETRMTESAAICQYLVTRYGPSTLAVAPDEPGYGPFLNWLHFRVRVRHDGLNASEASEEPACIVRCCLWILSAKRR